MLTIRLIKLVFLSKEFSSWSVKVTIGWALEKIDLIGLISLSLFLCLFVWSTCQLTETAVKGWTVRLKDDKKWRKKSLATPPVKRERERGRGRVKDENNYERVEKSEKIEATRGEGNVEWSFVCTNWESIVCLRRVIIQTSVKNGKNKKKKMEFVCVFGSCWTHSFTSGVSSESNINGKQRKRVVRVKQSQPSC